MLFIIFVSCYYDCDPQGVHFNNNSIIILFLIEFIYSSILKGKLNGGYNVEFGDAKYLVFITRKNVYQFGGCLISEKHVLTAAHNLQNFWVDLIIPYFGDYSVVIASINETLSGSKHLIEQVQTHRSYSPRNPKPSHDIAVITVDHSYF